MILLRRDCLVFEKPNGEKMPAPADEFALELVGEAVEALDEDILKNVAQAVVHYFKEALGRENITVLEFSRALEQTLRNLGFNVKSELTGEAKAHVVDTDLKNLAESGNDGFELLFFSRLREQLRLDLEKAPQLLRISGLRPCVKHLLGARRWGARCQSLSDQIVGFLRACLGAEKVPALCALVVS